MAMTYTSLAAAKGVSGSLANFVAYTLLDIPPIIDEAQALIYGFLRTREMKTEYSFTIASGGSYIALPSRFLDPIGRIYQTSFNRNIAHKDSSFIQQRRNYTETSGTLGTDPFTTTISSNSVSVALAGHGFNQDSLFYTTGASAVGGATIVGTFPITSITDADNFVIDISILGTTPSSSTTGGGASVAYTCDSLVQGTANWFGIWNERINFDTAFTQSVLCKLQYFQSLPLLATTTNESNFLTNRYPQLMRTACMTAAADFMKDDSEYNKGLTRLTALIQRINVENDMMMRGMELDPEIP